MEDGPTNGAFLVHFAVAVVVHRVALFVGIGVDVWVGIVAVSHRFCEPWIGAAPVHGKATVGRVTVAVDVLVEGPTGVGDSIAVVVLRVADFLGPGMNGFIRVVAVGCIFNVPIGRIAGVGWGVGIAVPIAIPVGVGYGCVVGYRYRKAKRMYRELDEKLEEIERMCEDGEIDYKRLAALESMQ
jgi:hypothetical protein